MIKIDSSIHRTADGQDLTDDVLNVGEGDGKMLHTTHASTLRLPTVDNCSWSQANTIESGWNKCDQTCAVHSSSG